jgi:two-component system alkaline phosphatase synthesis response regulator PhoP
MISKKNRKVLIIEDEEDMRDIYETKLAREGYDVVTADSGVKGLALAGEEQPKLILLDIVLPGKDGFSVLEELKANPKTKGIPVVIISNLNQDYEIKMAKDMGAEVYLTKADVTPDEVAENVRNILEKNDN